MDVESPTSIATMDLEATTSTAPLARKEGQSGAESVAPDTLKGLKTIDQDLETSIAGWVRKEREVISEEADQDEKEEEEKKKKDHVSCCSRPFFSIATFCSRLFGWYPDSLAFSFRFCVTATAAALFYLLPENDDPWARVIWIYVTATVLAWQPHRDLSSVLKLSLAQTIGVVIGAVLGLAVGFIALTIEDLRDRKIFLGLAVAVHGFLFPYVCDRLGYRGSPSAVMSTPTFGIVALAFYNQDVDDNPWLAGVYRVVTILIACAIVIVAAFVCFPVSTHSRLAKKFAAHLGGTGEFLGNVLDSALVVFSTKKKLPSHTALLMGEVQDDVFDQYMKDKESYVEFRRLLSSLQYDPWFKCGLDAKEERRFRMTISVGLMRASRIQENAMSLDSLLRSNIDFTCPEALDLIKNIGEDCRQVLDMSLDVLKREEAAKRLVHDGLVNLQARLSTLMGASPASGTVDIRKLTNILLTPNVVSFSPLDTKGEQTILFLQTLEMLVLRVARLHYFLLEMGPLPKPSFCCPTTGASATAGPTATPRSPLATPTTEVPSTASP